MGRVGQPTTVAAISLGSNLGDRRAHLEFAVYRLRSVLDDLRVSHFIETEPVAVSRPQPTFLNGAAVGVTPTSARALLESLLAIERERGRERPRAGAPRTLDLDLVLFGDRMIDEPGLVVPHPRFRERRFVLGPLVEIAPDLVDPGTGKTLRDLLDEITRRHNRT